MKCDNESAHDQKLTFMKRLLPIVPNVVLTELCAVFSGDPPQQQLEEPSTDYMTKLVGAIAGNNALRRRSTVELIL